MTRLLLSSIDWNFILRSLVLILFCVLRQREQQAFLARRLRGF